MMCGAISPKFGRGSRDEGWPAPLASSRNSSQPAAASTSRRPAEEQSVHGPRVTPWLKFSACTARALVAVLDFTIQSFSLPKSQLDGRDRDMSTSSGRLVLGTRATTLLTAALPFVVPFPSGLNI